jgi:midasin (ATPase involved in ribosome maturation)
MEPTLASKLQGDYRTGKRINMKKVLLFPMNLSLYVFLSPP